MSNKAQTPLSYLPERVVYDSMLQRCYNPSKENYYRYGGRGITVCQRWRKSFANFLADMGRRPSALHTLGRRNNNLPYSPDNCRWETKKTQARNRVSSRVLELDGVARTLAEWAEITGLRPGTISARIDLSGWTVRQALTTPVLRLRRKGGIQSGPA